MLSTECASRSVAELEGRRKELEQLVEAKERATEEDWDHHQESSIELRSEICIFSSHKRPDGSDIRKNKSCCFRQFTTTR